MAIFELSSTSIRQIDRTTFAEEKVTERYDLQRLLRRSIEHISPDTMILDEEYGSFEGSLRRIDLLGLTRDAELVVIELKRTEGGGHLELQAIRYAAMISAMTFDDAVEAHRHYLGKNGQEDEDPRQNIVAFLGQGPDPILSETVRIVLAAADFSPEVTTTVLWLNSSGLNSPWPLVSYGLNRCHAAPYRLNAIPYKSRTYPLFFIGQRTFENPAATHRLHKDCTHWRRFDGPKHINARSEAVERAAHRRREAGRARRMAER